jgi:hypothetical protein
VCWVICLHVCPAPRVAEFLFRALVPPVTCDALPQIPDCFSTEAAADESRSSVKQQEFLFT